MGRLSSRTKEVFVVPLTRLNGGVLHLNPDLIATVEEHHDTVVTLTDGACLVVAESAEQVTLAIVRFRAEILAASERLLALPGVHAPRPGAAPAPARILSLRPGTGQ